MAQEYDILPVGDISTLQHTFSAVADANFKKKAQEQKALELMQSSMLRDAGMDLRGRALEQRGEIAAGRLGLSQQELALKKPLMEAQTAAATAMALKRKADLDREARQSKEEAEFQAAMQGAVTHPDGTVTQGEDLWSMLESRNATERSRGAEKAYGIFSQFEGSTSPGVKAGLTRLQKYREFSSKLQMEEQKQAAREADQAAKQAAEGRRQTERETHNQVTEEQGSRRLDQGDRAAGQKDTSLAIQQQNADTALERLRSGKGGGTLVNGEVVLNVKGVGKLPISQIESALAAGGEVDRIMEAGLRNTPGVNDPKTGLPTRMIDDSLINQLREAGASKLKERQSNAVKPAAQVAPAATPAPAPVAAPAQVPAASTTPDGVPPALQKLRDKFKVQPSTGGLPAPLSMTIPTGDFGGEMNPAALASLPLVKEFPVLFGQRVAPRDFGVFSLPLGGLNDSGA